MEKSQTIALFKEYCALPENTEKMKHAAFHQQNRLIWDISGPQFGFRINNVGLWAKIYIFPHYKLTGQEFPAAQDLSQDEFNDLLKTYIGSFPTGNH